MNMGKKVQVHRLPQYYKYILYLFILQLVQMPTQTHEKTELVKVFFFDTKHNSELHDITYNIKW